MMPPLHPVLFRHLCEVQRSTAPVESFFHRQQSILSRMSWYRMTQSLGDALLVIPSVAVERLGLVHLHVFITSPGDAWVQCPYAVEASWVTPDLCTEVLYLHCLIPAQRKDHVLSLLRTFHCDQYEAVWSSTGWQQFLDDEDEVSIPVADPVVPSSVLREYPLVVPVVMEFWRHPNSMPLVWERLRSTLSQRLRFFLPRTKIHYVNGRLHVGAMLRHLQREGLLRQHIIRYHPLLAASVEVFLTLRMDRDDVRGLVEGLRSCLHAVESYPTSDGYLVRLLGPHRLLDAIMMLPSGVRSRAGMVFFHTKRHPAPRVRFAYETLFDPTTTWEVLA